MAEILSFQDARHVADRAEALAYVERMTAFQEEMRRLTGLFGVSGGRTAEGPVPARSAQRRA